MTGPVLVRVAAAASMVALGWALAARALGPSDLWDQVQARTVSYTTDIVANGRWVLPIERGVAPATKPPLYNWVAAPAVKAIGFDSEPAHKIPSVLALLGGWLLVVRAGRAIGAHPPDAGGGSGDGSGDGPGPGDAVGWLAGLMFAANYAIFKLGYLARPDMLLTFFLLLGWWAGTAIVTARPGAGARSPGRLALVFWLCVGLAALTKGPAALTLVIWAPIAARLVGGPGAAGRFRWGWGLPLALAIPAVWLLLAWRIDPDHVRRVFLFDEVLGRVTGLGSEGRGDGSGGPGQLLLELPKMLGYFLVRFAPWSVPAVLAIVALWTRPARGDGPRPPRRWRSLGPAGGGLQAAALFVVVVLAFYSVSIGKRADYEAAAYGPGAILASWWLLGVAPRLAATLVPVAGAVALTVMTVHNERQALAPVRGFGDAIMSFTHAARARIDRDEHPVAFRTVGPTHVQAMLGSSEREGNAAVLALIDRGETAWVVAGGPREGPGSLEHWLSRRRPGVAATPVVRSAVLPEARGWPIQLSLYLVETPTPQWYPAPQLTRFWRAVPRDTEFKGGGERFR